MQWGTWGFVPRRRAGLEGASPCGNLGAAEVRHAVLFTWVGKALKACLGASGPGRGREERKEGRCGAPAALPGEAAPVNGLVCLSDASYMELSFLRCLLKQDAAQRISR